MNDGILNKIDKLNINDAQKPNRRHKNGQISEEDGAQLLSKCFTTTVFELTKNYRVKDKLHRELLERIRTNDPNESDCQRLCNLHFSNYGSKEQQEYRKKVESDPKTVFLFTKNSLIKKYEHHFSVRLKGSTVSLLWI